MQHINEITLKILNQRMHGVVVKNLSNYGKMEFNEIDGFITYYNPNQSQESWICKMIVEDVYQIQDADIPKYRDLVDYYGHPVVDDSFIEVDPLPGSEYNTFEEYYAHLKHDYLHGNDTVQRESKRIHEGFVDLIKNISITTGSNNNTAITSMLLAYGAIQFYSIIPLIEFKTIREYYVQHSTSAFIHTDYESGLEMKHKLSIVVRRYTNSRSQILDMNRGSSTIHYYPDEFVFKTIEDLNFLGFGNRKTSYGFEILLCLALKKTNLADNTQFNEKICSLIDPTLDSILKLIPDIQKIQQKTGISLIN